MTEDDAQKIDANEPEASRRGVQGVRCLMTTAEVGQVLRVSKKTLQRMRRRWEHGDRIGGGLPFCRPPGEKGIFYRAEDVEAFKASMVVPIGP